MLKGKRIIQKGKEGFRCVEWSHGAHGSHTLRVWINKRIPTQTDEDGDEVLEFPVQGAEVQATQKGNLVIRPKKGRAVFLYELSSGYRGSANVTGVGDQGGAKIVTQIKQLHSGRGALGETAVALINGTISGVLVHWRRTGRRVDRTEGATWLYPDGGQVDAFGEEDESLEDMLS
jgi:hypothetical protein